MKVDDLNENGFDEMVKRVGERAKQGPLKTVWDPVKRLYKNVPVTPPVKKEENEEVQAPQRARTVYPNAVIIKTRTGKPVGELYVKNGSWCCLHYKSDEDACGLADKPAALEKLRDIHHQYMEDRSYGRIGGGGYTPLRDSYSGDSVTFTNFLIEGSEFATLEKNKQNLTDEERKTVMDAKAVWHHGPKGAPSPAVWKSVCSKTGKCTYVTHTHRAYNTAPTLKGAISRYHKFIKSTA